MKEYFGQNIWGEIISLPNSTRVGGFVDIGNPNFGEDCLIEAMVTIPPGWKFGNRIFVGPSVHFANDKHPNLQESFEPQGGIVEDDVVIGMGSLINKSIPSGCLAGGVPAKILKQDIYPSVWSINRLEEIKQSYQERANWLGLPCDLHPFPDGFYINGQVFQVSTRGCPVDLDETGEDFRNFLRQRGIRFRTGKPYKASNRRPVCSI